MKLTGPAFAEGATIPKKCTDPWSGPVCTGSG